MGTPDEQRFDAAFRAHHAAVHRFVARRAAAGAVDDVVAETFLIAWRRRRDVPDEPLPWLYAVARRVLANHRRAEHRAVDLRDALEAVERSRPPAAPVEDATLAHAVAGVVATLPPADREVLMLHAWEGLDRHEAAAVLGCRPATYAVRLHRARRRLRAALNPAPTTIAPATNDLKGSL